MAHTRKGVVYRVTKTHNPDPQRFRPGDVVRRTGTRVTLVRRGGKR